MDKKACRVVVLLTKPIALLVDATVAVAVVAS